MHTFKPFVLKKKEPLKSGAYQRTKAQREREDWSDMGESDRSYKLSCLDSGTIHYPNAGDKL